MTLITNIQKYSIHDGDGIRTSVFFKGCPLKCAWCHNPETQNFKKQILTNREKCTGCGACVQACPNGAIRIEDGKAVTDHNKCDGCGKCTEYCLANIREVAGKEYAIKELVKELKKDEMFYEESGGGVTLSGGEVMCMDMDYIFFRNSRNKGRFHLLRRSSFRKSDFRAYSKKMRIYRHNRLMEHDVQNYVRSFSSYAGKNHKLFSGIRNFAAEFFKQDTAKPDDVRSLAPVKPD